MSNSIYPFIRRALESRLAATSGIPAIAPENGQYAPATGTPFIRTQFIPSMKKPVTIGPNYVEHYRGIFRCILHYPPYKGPNDTDEMVDTIINRFLPSTDISFTSGSDTKIINIMSSERSLSYEKEPWFVTHVNISWYIYN